MDWEEELITSGPDDVFVFRVVAAIRSLLTQDKHLLQVDASERSISHRLAVHLTPQFKDLDLDVDCEYNRNRHDIKRLHLPGPCARSADADGSPVFPDIIVHRRGTDINILVIEIKKSTSSVPENYDLEKLSAFRMELQYKAALFLQFHCDPMNPTIGSFEWR